MIVPAAVAVVIVPPTGPESVTVKVSFGSTVVSPLTLMVITLEVSPAVKVTVPLGSTSPGEVGRVGRIGAAAGDRVVHARRAAGVAAAGHGEGKGRAAASCLPPCWRRWPQSPAWAAAACRRW